MNHKFDMGAAWSDTWRMLSANKEAVAIIAGLLVAVPFAAFLLFASQSISLADFKPEMTPMETFELFAPVIWAVIPLFICTQIGSLAISRLLLAEGGTTVGESLRFGIVFALTVIAAQLIVTIALQLPQLAADSLIGDNAAAGILVTLLMIPVSIYFSSGRLVAATPTIAARGIGNPIKALKESWELTRGNGWRVGIFVTLTILMIGIVAAVALGIVLLILFVLPIGIRGLFIWIPVSVFFAAFSVIGIGLAAAVYRQLAGPDASALSEEFS